MGLLKCQLHWSVNLVVMSVLMNVCIYIYIYILYIYIHTHMHTHTRTRARAHAHTHTHIHTLTQSVLGCRMAPSNTTSGYAILPVYVDYRSVSWTYIVKIDSVHHSIVPAEFLGHPARQLACGVPHSSRQLACRRPTHVCCSVVFLVFTVWLRYDYEMPLSYMSFLVQVTLVQAVRFMSFACELFFPLG